MRAIALIPLMLLAACGEPSFDERYDGAEQEIRNRAAEFEKDLDGGREDDAPAVPGDRAEPARASNGSVEAR